MDEISQFVKRNREVCALTAVILILTTVPVLMTASIVGDAWQGILPPLTDDIYEARVQTIGEGHLSAGNPYYLEHSDGPPLVIFGGAWLNAIPLWLGGSLVTAMMVNFIIWSLLFAASLYWLFRELRTKPWVAVVGTVFVYLQSYFHVWRPVNMQTVYPFIFLFYVALLLFIREQSRKNIVFLGLVTGAAFYLYAYFWQAALITLGLMFLYALANKNWTLVKGSFQSSCIGVLVGLPVPLYALWLSHTSPFFWESVARLGLVNTHLPMAEVIYSGGWIGVVCALIAVLSWRVKSLKENRDLVMLGIFFVITGLGLWIMGGSNLITGKLLETGEHVSGLIYTWLAVATVSIAALLWDVRGTLPRAIQYIAIVAIVLMSVASIKYTLHTLTVFVSPSNTGENWRPKQSYSKPFLWLQDMEPTPVVVWSDPHGLSATLLPEYTRHFSLDAYWGMLELVPEGEIRERYLISQYFDNPTIETLMSSDELPLYLGRRDQVHQSKTIERGIKLCRIAFFWDKGKDCGTIPTPQSLLGNQFFFDLEKRLQNDIRPNIKAYLKKYHVTYILKDKTLNPSYLPEKLGFVLAYSDDRFELWHL